MTDPSLLELFRAELEIHLPVLNEGLLVLEKDSQDPKRLEALMRAAHSIKGAAKIVGVETAVRVAHVLEDCFVAAQEGKIHLNSDSIDVLLQGVDALHRVGGSESIAEAELTRLMDAISAVRTGTSSARAAVVTQPTPQTGPPTVRPTGDLDATEAERLRLQLLDLLGRGVSRIRLDFSAVEVLEPAALGLLVCVARETNRRSPTVAFEVVNARPQVQTLLRVTRLDEAFPLVAGESRS